MNKIIIRFKKVINILVLTCLLFITTLSPVYALEFKEAVAGTAQISSYELFFPMVAGIIPGKKIYILKFIRDKKDEFLAFGRFQKTKVNLHLSNKRLLEVEQLLLLNKNELVIKTLKKSHKHLFKAIDLSRGLKKEEEVLSTALMISESASKQQKFLPYLARGQEENVSKFLEENYNFAKYAFEFSDNLLFEFLHGEK